MAAGQWQDTEATSSELTMRDQQCGQTRIPTHEAAPEAESMSPHNSDAEGELSHLPSDTTKRKKRKRRKKNSDSFDTAHPAAAASVDINPVEAPAKARKNRAPRKQTPIWTCDTRVGRRRSPHDT